MTVPATPKKDAATAADTAARAPATTWVIERVVRGCWSGRASISVRGEVMGSDGVVGVRGAEGRPGDLVVRPGGRPDRTSPTGRMQAARTRPASRPAGTSSV